jgi:hypothetical protein
MKENSGRELKLFETNCTIMPDKSLMKAVWRFRGRPEADSDIELQCTKAMVEKFNKIKRQHLQSLADSLDRRLSSGLSDSNLLLDLSELTSPLSILALDQQ